MRIVDSNGILWAELLDVRTEGEWIFATWIPRNIPVRAVQLLAEFNHRGNNHELALLDEIDEAIDTYGLLLVSESGNKAEVYDIQLDEDGREVAIKVRDTSPAT